MDLTRSKILKLIEDQVKNVRLCNEDLDEFPIEIIAIKGMTHLNLGGNNISEIPESIYQLRDLRYLNLSNNKLTSLPVNFFGRLKNLTNLDLRGNNFLFFPESILELDNLELLDISDNQLINIPRGIIELNKLRGLYIGHNNIKQIPIQIVESHPYKSTLIAIKDYYEALEKGEDEIFEAKLILVGTGAVGKTSIANKIIDINYELKKEETTKGIEILSWSFPIPNKNGKRFIVNIWDFGGQQIYYKTHQFFLTKRSFYLLVWNARQEEDLKGFNYWLNIISLLSERSPVAIVQNKVDEHSDDIQQKLFKETFTNITEFFKTSCDTNQGIDDLRNHIKDQMLKLPHIGDLLPSVWIEVRKSLQSRTENYITYERYIEICQSYKLSREKSHRLSGYLHDLGSILHFSDDPLLKETVILKPDWATQAVYLVLNDSMAKINFGKLEFKEIEKIWTENKYFSKHAELLRLMNKFEISFEVNEKDKKFYIIPQLLKADKPDNFTWSGNNEFRMEYHYYFMPAGIFTRLMVRLHHLIEDKGHFWRNGVIFSKDNGGTKAFIENKPFEDKLLIEISGKDKPGLLSLIRLTINEIHQTLNNPIAFEMFGCSCTKCINGEREMYKLEKLNDALDMGISEIQCQNSWSKVSIKEILYGFDNISTITAKTEKHKLDLTQFESQEEYYESILNMIEDFIESKGRTREEIEYLKFQLKIIQEKNDLSESQKALNRINSFFNSHAKDIRNSAIGGAIIELGKIILGM